MAILTTSHAVFACHSAACRPPTSGGTGGSSPVSGGAKIPISGGVKAWWRMAGGSAELTTAARSILGMDGRAVRVDSEARDAASHILESIGSQPVTRTKLYSGHRLANVPESVPKVGSEIDIPLMALAHREGLAQAYAGVSMAKTLHPLKGQSVKGMVDLLKTLDPTPGKSDADRWRDANPDVKDLIGQLSGATRRQPERVVYEFASSRSSAIESGKERVTSGRYRVTGVERRNTPEWRYHSDQKDFLPGTYTVVQLEYVGAVGS